MDKWSQLTKKLIALAKRDHDDRCSWLTKNRPCDCGADEHNAEVTDIEHEVAMLNFNVLNYYWASSPSEIKIVKTVAVE
jgi:hypothetical protein